MAEVYKSAGVEAAKIAGESPEMDELAERVMAKAIAIATAHRFTGAYVSAFGVERAKGKRGVTDRIVYNDDPAAVSIEWGHVTALGKGRSGPGRWVPGQHILGGAAGQV